jgi:hypothetical protein
MENVGIISVHLEYFPAIWDTYFKAYRWCCGNLSYFSPFLVHCVKEKSGNPGETQTGERNYRFLP